ncbi:hypothetical protein B7Z00_03150 [Candidatus Saccharibacteria bacterium 32-50-10]|nr:MAG: hypothetical protein B7Z00_03150 [Candidatus Saccharibacteria bacterium 32-50-10]
MTNYVRLPVTREKIRGGFCYTTGEKLTSQEEERLACILDELVRTANRAVWMSPEKDRTEAKVFGDPLELDERPLRYMPQREGAIFPVTETFDCE